MKKTKIKELKTDSGRRVGTNSHYCSLVWNMLNEEQKQPFNSQVKKKAVNAGSGY